MPIFTAFLNRLSLGLTSTADIKRSLHKQLAATAVEATIALRRLSGIGGLLNMGGINLTRGCEGAEEFQVFIFPAAPPLRVRFFILVATLGSQLTFFLQPP